MRDNEKIAIELSKKIANGDCDYHSVLRVLDAKNSEIERLKAEVWRLREEIKELKNQCEREDELKRIALKDKYELIDKIEDLKKTLNERNSIPEWKKVQSLEAEIGRLREAIKNAVLKTSIFGMIDPFNDGWRWFYKLQQAIEQTQGKEEEK